MNLAHYPVKIPYDALAENLVNSLDVTLPEPEHLRSAKDLRHFMAHHGLAPGRLNVQDLDGVRELRAVTRGVFESNDVEQAIYRVNALLDGKHYVAAMSVQGSVELEWQISSEETATARLEGAVALNLAVLLQTVGFERCRVCMASPCQDVFIDLSKKGSRIFCGPRCASRVHVARFRSRTGR